MDLAWLESIVAQCRAAGVKCFVKQDSGPRAGQQGRISNELWSLKQFPTGKDAGC
jgi:protein gp37